MLARQPHALSALIFSPPRNSARFILSHSLGLTLGGIKIGVLLGEVLGVCRRHGVMLEPKMANVVLSTIVLEGVGRTMDPGLNLFKAAMPFVTMRK